MENLASNLHPFKYHFTDITLRSTATNIFIQLLLALLIFHCCNAIFMSSNCDWAIEGEVIHISLWRQLVTRLYSLKSWSEKTMAVFYYISLKNVRFSSNIDFTPVRSKLSSYWLRDEESMRNLLRSKDLYRIPTHRFQPNTQDGIAIFKLAYILIVKTTFWSQTIQIHPRLPPCEGTKFFTILQVSVLGPRLAFLQTYPEGCGGWWFHRCNIRVTLCSIIMFTIHW